MAPQAYVARLAPILAGWWGEVPELGAPGHPLYGRLGVRYLLAAPDARLPPPLERRLRGRRRLASGRQPGAADAPLR